MLRLLRWCVGAVLGLHLALALLLLGQNPALFRAAVLMTPRGPAHKGGMRLAVYQQPEPSGRGWRQRIPGAVTWLELRGGSLEAYATWQIRETGTYVLVFECDDRGAVFVDGHRVIGLRGKSANRVGRAAVRLDAGRHLLVIELTGGPEHAEFRLEVQGPGDSKPEPLSPSDLRPMNQRYLPYFWRAALRGAVWTWHPVFWGSLGIVAVLAAASWPARTLTQVALNALLIVAGSGFGLVVGEVGSRLALPPPETVTFKATGPAAGEGRNVFMIRTERGFRHNPNTEVVVRHPANPDTPTLYRTNSIGYRNREIGPKQGRRILFLGDSITLGLALNEPDTFVRRVEEIAHARGTGWETINAGVDGLGMNGELAVLNETGLALSPDVVVLDFYLNDFLESPGIYLTRLPGLIDRSRLAHWAANLLSRHLLLSVSERDPLDSPPMLKPPDEIYAWQDEFKTASTVMTPNQLADGPTRDLHGEVLRHFEDWGGAFSPHVWPAMESLLAEFARLGHEHGFRFVIVAFPVRQQVESALLYDYPQRRLREITRTLGVPFLDLLPVLRAEHGAAQGVGRPMFFDHCHLTPHGSEIVAPVIYEFLKDADETRPRPGGPRGGAGARRP